MVNRFGEALLSLLHVVVGFFLPVPAWGFTFQAEKRHPIPFLAWRKAVVVYSQRPGRYFERYLCGKDRGVGNFPPWRWLFRRAWLAELTAGGTWQHTAL